MGQIFPLSFWYFVLQHLNHPKINFLKTSWVEECCFLWLLPSCPQGSMFITSIPPAAMQLCFSLCANIILVFPTLVTHRLKEKRKETVSVVEPWTFFSALMKREIQQEPLSVQIWSVFELFSTFLFLQSEVLHVAVQICTRRALEGTALSKIHTLMPERTEWADAA